MSDPLLIANECDYAGCTAEPTWIIVGEAPLMAERWRPTFACEGHLHARVEHMVTKYKKFGGLARIAVHACARGVTFTEQDIRWIGERGHKPDERNPTSA